MRTIPRVLKAAVAASALAASLLAVELALRALELPRFDACSATADWAVPDPRLGWAAAPGATVAGVHLNEDGLRGPRLATPKPAGRRRVVVLGDSTAWGLGVAFDETFGARVAAGLGENAELGLVAFPGYSSYHSRVLAPEVVRLEPDLVLLYVGARNDGSRARYYADAQIPARRRRLAAAWHQCHLLRGLEAVLDRLERSVLWHLRSEPGRVRVPPDAFRENLESIAHTLAATRAAVVVVVPPLSASLAARQPLAPRYRALLRAFAASHGYALVDLVPVFAGADEHAVYAPDGFHLTAAGHALAAGAILSAIR